MDSKEEARKEQQRKVVALLASLLLDPGHVPLRRMRRSLRVGVGGLMEGTMATVMRQQAWMGKGGRDQC